MVIVSLTIDKCLLGSVDTFFVVISKKIIEVIMLKSDQCKN